VLEYCRRQDGVKPEWLVVEEFVSREKAQEFLSSSQSEPGSLGESASAELGTAEAAAEAREDA
jgi:hypothetical protein